MRPWVAPTPAGPVTGSLTVPGSKSATARGYVLAALGDGPSVLTGVLDARDTRLMRAALASLGVDVTDLAPGVVRVAPPAVFTPGDIHCGLAGTIMRFVPALAALADGPTRFRGDPEASARPVAPLLDGLGQLGVRVDHPASVPFTVHGTGAVPGGTARIDASASSQFVSGLLLAAARFDAGLELVHAGARVPSPPHIRMTLAMLADRGVVASASANDTAWRVAPGPIAARDETIEPDLVNAATFLAAALVTGGAVTVPWPRHTVQASDAILGTLAALGGEVDARTDTVTVSGTGTVTGADVDLTLASELTCVVAALLALADRPGSIRGVGHVRHHETDRLAALTAELGARGARVAETADGLTIAPGRLTGGPWRTYADHRMAHAGAVLGLAVAGVELDDVDATTKTIADFGTLWHTLVAA
ncbi:3-phosphoshikimate 1-carboxyvinyltransferase [Propioniciclava soli]|uniref:3-phosphoshikimate 1-carboxyvinyltransferase n=1 Tax=Propioniciclava soli TaxID=2775081 RepID=UPI001E40D8AA